MSGEIPDSANHRAMYSTIGVFPLPPQVKFPTLITGIGNLQNPRQQMIINENNKRKKRKEKTMTATQPQLPLFGYPERLIQLFSFHHLEKTNLVLFGCQEIVGNRLYRKKKKKDWTPENEQNSLHEPN